MFRVTMERHPPLAAWLVESLSADLETEKDKAKDKDKGNINANLDHLRAKWMPCFLLNCSDDRASRSFQTLVLDAVTVLESAVCASPAKANHHPNIHEKESTGSASYC